MFFPVMPVAAFSGAFQHGPRQAWAIKLLRDAIASAGLSEKEAADIAGLSHPHFSRQCQNIEGSHFSYQRVFEFPAEVLKALARGLCAELDLVCIESKDVQRLVAVNERIADALAARHVTVETDERRIA